MTINDLRPVERRALDEGECFMLLGRESEGRLALSVGARRITVPIHFALDGRTITFSAELDVALDSPGDHGAVACLEVEWFDDWAREGWRVLAIGELKRQADGITELPMEFVSGCRLTRVMS